MKQKGFAPIITLIFIALAVATVYFLGTKNILKLTTFLPSPVLSPSPTTDSTANWETYMNGQLYFSIKYPPGVTYKEIGEDGSVVFLLDSERGKNLNDLSVSLQILRRDKHGSEPLDNFIGSEVCGGCSVPTTESASINNAVGIKVASGATKDYYLTNIDKNRPVVRLMLSGTDQENIKIFDQILSTFKFLEATPSASPTP